MSIENVVLEKRLALLKKIVASGRYGFALGSVGHSQKDKPSSEFEQEIRVIENILEDVESNRLKNKYIVAVEDVVPSI